MGGPRQTRNAAPLPAALQPPVPRAGLPRAPRCTHGARRRSEPLGLEVGGRGVSGPVGTEGSLAEYFLDKCISICFVSLDRSAFDPDAFIFQKAVFGHLLGKTIWLSCYPLLLEGLGNLAVSGLPTLSFLLPALHYKWFVRSPMSQQLTTIEECQAH